MTKKRKFSEFEILPKPAQAAKKLNPQAQRALKEAEERRRLEARSLARAGETGGRKGPDPTRYGDWEKDGIASDF